MKCDCNSTTNRKFNFAVIESFNEPLAKVYFRRVVNAWLLGSSDDQLRAYQKVCTDLSSDEDGNHPSQPFGRQPLLAHSLF